MASGPRGNHLQGPPRGPAPRPELGSTDPVASVRRRRAASGSHGWRRPGAGRPRRVGDRCFCARRSRRTRASRMRARSPSAAGEALLGRPAHVRHDLTRERGQDTARVLFAARPAAHAYGSMPRQGDRDEQRPLDEEATSGPGDTKVAWTPADDVPVGSYAMRITGSRGRVGAASTADAAASSNARQRAGRPCARTQGRLHAPPSPPHLSGWRYMLSPTRRGSR